MCKISMAVLLLDSGKHHAPLRELAVAHSDLLRYIHGDAKVRGGQPWPLGIL